MNEFSCRTRLRPSRLFAATGLFIVSLFGMVGSALVSPARLAAQSEPVDREYVLEASFLGYRGVGGEIDGLTNPVLRAAIGDRVSITIVGVEPLPHDIS